MKRIYLLLAVCLLASVVNAQNYNNTLNYYYNGTPTNGVKIKTNIPFVSGSQMPTITIQGFNYGTHEPIGLTLVFYIWYNGADPSTSAYFYFPTITSFGSYTPPVYLSNESGKVVIFINDLSYFQRFTISAYAQGQSETSAQYSGWTTADEAISGTQTVLVPYQSRLAGNAFLPGNGIWSSNGNVGIGTTTPQEALSVNGNIRSKQVKVEITNWPDYVFKSTYHLPSLTEVKTYIDLNHHLPDMPPEADVTKDGLNLGEMNRMLTKKVEELTLYLIEKDNKDKEKDVKLQSQQEQINELKQQLKALNKN